MPTSTSYVLSVKDTIKTSWAKVSGAKWAFCAAIGLSILISFAFGFLSGIMGAISNFLEGTVSLIGQVITSLISMGILYMGILRARNAPLHYKQMFYVFDRPMIYKVIGLYLIMILIFFPITVIISLVPMLVFGLSIEDKLASGFSVSNFFVGAWILAGIIISIYIMLRLILSTAFVVDKASNPWAALKLSVMATRHNALPLLALLIFQMFVFGIAFLPLIVALGVTDNLLIIALSLPLCAGLIWVFPWVFIMYGVAYKNLLANVGK